MLHRKKVRSTFFLTDMSFDILSRLFFPIHLIFSPAPSSLLRDRHRVLQLRPFLSPSLSTYLLLHCVVLPVSSMNEAFISSVLVSVINLGSLCKQPFLSLDHSSCAPSGTADQIKALAVCTLHDLIRINKETSFILPPSPSPPAKIVFFLDILNRNAQSLRSRQFPSSGFCVL